MQQCFNSFVCQSGDDTPTNVRRMCAKAKNPLRKDFIEKLVQQTARGTKTKHLLRFRVKGLQGRNIHVGAVCVYPNRVADCVAALEGVRALVHDRDINLHCVEREHCVA